MFWSWGCNNFSDFMNDIRRRWKESARPVQVFTYKCWINMLLPPAFPAVGVHSLWVWFPAISLPFLVVRFVRLGFSLAAIQLCCNGHRNIRRLGTLGRMRKVFEVDYGQQFSILFWCGHGSIKFFRNVRISEWTVRVIALFWSSLVIFFHVRNQGRKSTFSKSRDGGGLFFELVQCSCSNYYELSLSSQENRDVAYLVL